MLNDFYILSFVSLLAIIFTPIFIKIRSGMSKKTELKTLEFQAYTRNKILQISFSHFLLVVAGLFFEFLLFFAIKNRSGSFILNNNDFVFFIVFVFICLLVTYGAGSYIAAIIIEQCMVQPNQNHPTKLKALRLYNEFFHGPFSHVLIYSGTNSIFLLFAFFEKNYQLFSDGLFALYGIYGIILGGVFFYWQLVNLTWKHQMPWFIILFISHITFIYINKLNLISHPFNFFYLMFAITLNTSLFLKFIFYRKRGRYYRYNLKFDQLFK